MPLFRRNSSKERKQTSSTERHLDESGINSSLYERLSRRRSSASENNIAINSHEGSQSSIPVNPAATPTKPQASNTARSHSRSHSQSRHRSSSRSSPATSKHGATTTSSDPEPEHIHGGLTKDDVQHLFSGAPHFTLEKGRRGRYFPQALFPWNNQLDITDLQDRPYLKHESFALSTMHAHLPVPDEVNWKPGMPHPQPAYSTPSETGKRPMFDLGIYERPNMLGITAMEIGTMGFRAYLERPVADGLRETTQEQDVDVRDTGAADDPRSPGRELDLEHLSASEAFKALAHESGDARVGKHAPKQDRNVLMKGGAKAWKVVGVRDVSMDDIAARLCYVSKIREDVVAKGWTYTILNTTTETEMGEYLFGKLLYPPSKMVDGKSGDRDMKVQIEALVKALTTPGVWLDFSLPRERILWVQALYTTRQEDQNVPDHHGILPGEKRRWNLIQLTLALELVIRLDAVLRLGVATHRMNITPQEIHHFNKLRNLKVDWDLVVARRFLDLCYAKKIPLSLESPAEIAAGAMNLSSPPQSPGKEHHHFLGRFTKSLSVSGKEQGDPTYTLAILPRQPRMMVEGLIRFGTFINWPTIEAVRQSLIAKLAVSNEQGEEMLARGVEPLHHERVAAYDDDHGCLEVRPASEHTVGGPLSHGWLGGFIIPGHMSSSLLICALLENDPEGKPLETLGNKAWTRDGFVWRGRSWWSKQAIACLVMAPSEGTVERMGWMGLPAEATPVNSKTGKVFGDGWVLVQTAPTKSTRQGFRIHDGEAMSKESSPLGVGHGKVSSNEFNMVTDHIFDSFPKLGVNKVQLVMDAAKDRKALVSEKEQWSAAVSAEVIQEGQGARSSIVIPLHYDIRFISGYPCRPPHGHATASHTSGEDNHPVHKHLEHLPAHPLHKSFKFVVKPLSELLQLETADSLADPHDKEAACVWIVDARGDTARKERGGAEPEVQEAPRPGQGGPGGMREILARAWCAKVGKDALVSRVGMQCAGCAVREARALEIGMVVRVGDVLG